MKLSRFRNAALTVGVCLLISAYAYFHAVVTKTIFIVALDQMIVSIMDKLWGFISTPTVFIATLLFIIILKFRENIIAIFPSIREIRAVDFQQFWTTRFHQTSLRSHLT